MDKEFTEQQRTNREKSNANLKMFKPGQSGNPGGRPKGVSYVSHNYRHMMSCKIPKEDADRIIEKTKGMDFSKMLKDFLDEGLTFSEYFSFIQLVEAAKGRTAAISEITDRTEGRPSQELRHTGAGGGPLVSANYDFTKLSTEKLKALRDTLLEAKKDDEP